MMETTINGGDALIQLNITALGLPKVCEGRSSSNNVLMLACRRRDMTCLTLTAKTRGFGSIPPPTYQWHRDDRESCSNMISSG